MLFSLSLFGTNEKVEKSVSIADSLRKNGDYLASLKLLEEAYIQAETHRDTLLLYKINQRLGNLFIEWENQEKAYFYYKNALNLALSTKSNRLIAGAYNNLGTIFSNQKLWDSSLHYYEKSHAIYQSEKDSFSVAGTSNNIGTIYNYKKQYNNSIIYFSKAFEVMKKLGKTEDAAVFALNISGSYKSLGRQEKAVYYIKIGEELAKQINDARLNMRVANSYALLYETFGDYEKANNYYKEYYQLNDSLYSLEKHQQIVKWQEKYESEKHKNTIELLQKQKEIDRISLRKQNVIIYAVVFVGLLVIVILFLVIHQNKLKTKVLQAEKWNLNNKQEKLISEKKLQESENQLLKDRIAHKERELVSATMHILQKNELIQKLKEDLDGINKHLQDDSLHDFSMVMKGLTSQSGVWENFNFHFEQVHPDFFKFLKRDFPHLTQNDLKVSAFIKIGLNNKEIASLMQIAPDSVKSSKKRLKKKLSLMPEHNLSDFLMSV